MSEDKILHGVNVTTVENAVKAIEEKPELAKFKFRLNNKWINGGHNHSTISNFYGTSQEISHLKTFELDSDEPPVLYSLPLTLTQSDKVQTARPEARVGGIPKPTAADLREDPLYGRFGSQPTAMDISPDGKIVAVLTYKRPYLFYRQENESWPRVFDRPPISLDMPRMRQAEAMSFNTDGTSLIVTSEKLPAPLYRLDIKP